jgi:PadR family transcriptional regulator PadR
MGWNLMNTQFKKGVVELCILKLLSEKDMYGFEVIEALANLLFVNENTVYPILRRLTQQGLFTIYTKETNLGAPRKYYHLTAKGRKQLEEYLKEWNLFIKNVYLILGGDYE